jgi:flagellar hook-associated protein 2
MADAPLFSVGGLASGLDTASIIDGLTKIEQQPLDALRTQQTGFKTQVSLIGQLVGKINALQSAAKSLASGGVVGVKTTSANTDFTATASSQTQAGNYAVSVQTLATAAQQRTGGFLPDVDGNTPVTGGTLSFTVQGKTYDPITISDGENLADVAGDIRALGAPISAVVLNDGTRQYLSITNLDTGFSGTDASTALQINETSTGTQGQALGFTSIHDASNATFTIDKLQFTRQSNTVTDALPGTTLSLKGQTNTTESLTFSNDSATTALNLQNFVNAYNDIITTVAAQQSAGGGNTDRNSTLAGNSTLRSLVADVQGLMTSVIGAGSVRTLADVGLKTNFQDGTLTIDSGKLGSALQANPQAINDIFSHATTGIGASVQTLTDRYTNVIDGLFTTSTKSLNTRISQMDTQADSMAARIADFKANLTAQFTAMEQIVSGLKTTGNFLNSQSASASSSK